MTTLTISMRLVLAILFTTSSAVAGGLASHPDAVNGATGAQVSSAGGLNVTVEYAVLRAADFNNDFGGLFSLLGGT